MMTLDRVRERVEEIRKMGDDHEGAHIAEDDLWGDVLADIANGHPESSELAKIALTTLMLDFTRWYA